MASQLEVVIDFLDGRPSETRSVPFQYSPGQEKGACMQLIGAMAATGGILDFGDDSVSLIPMATIKLVTAKAPAIIAGDLCDLQHLDAAVNRGKVTL